MHPFLAVAVRPWLWRVALRSAPVGWWRRVPFLPMPTDAYRRFRSITMYGGTGHRLDSADIVQFLQWVRKFPPVAGGAR